MRKSLTFRNSAPNYVPVRKYNGKVEGIFSTDLLGYVGMSNFYDDVWFMFSTSF